MKSLDNSYEIQTLLKWVRCWCFGECENGKLRTCMGWCKAMGGIELTLGMLLLLVMLMLKLINMAMLMQRCEGKNMHGLLLLSDERN